MEITNNLSEKALYDYKIVRNAIAGDEKAYGELFKRYKDSVYFMILKMVNNRTDAEDLMFEAFEKAFASLNYYSPQFAFSTWLFKIASNNTGSSGIWSDIIVRKKKTAEQFVYLNNHKQMYKYEQQFSISCVGSLQPQMHS